MRLKTARFIDSKEIIHTYTHSCNVARPKANRKDAIMNNLQQLQREREAQDAVIAEAGA